MVNSKTKAKIAIDVVMSVLFLLLMNTGITGILLHEALAVVILGLFIAHLAINRKWLVNIARRIKAPKSAKLKGIFALNAAIGLAAATTIVSGILISQYLFVPLASGNTALWYGIHDVSAWVTLGLLMAHGTLHWRWVKGVLQQFAQRAAGIKVVAVRAGVGLLALGAVLSLLNNNLGDILQPSNTTTGQSTSAQTTQQGNTTITSSGNSTTKTYSTTISSTNTTQTDITLQEFLSKLYCTGCHKHCPLSNPQCRRSAQQIEEQTAIYNETYVNE